MENVKVNFDKYKSFVTYENFNDKMAYSVYKKDPDNFDGNKKDMKIYDVLAMNGFSLNKVGTYYFKELISYICYVLEQNPELSTQELIELVKNEKSYIYVEVANFYLEIGKPMLVEAIEKANEDTLDGVDYKVKAIAYSKYLTKEKQNVK